MKRLIIGGVVLLLLAGAALLHGQSEVPFQRWEYLMMGYSSTLNVAVVLGSEDQQPDEYNRQFRQMAIAAAYDAVLLPAYLNTLGDAGWELINFQSSLDGVTTEYVFKRPIS